jgi:1-acyl-sn-glycerol-3-phosphate acyltransferase
MLFAVLRLTLIVPLVGLFLLPLFVRMVIRRPGDPLQGVRRSAWFCRVFLRILNIHIHAGRTDLRAVFGQAGLKVFNHLSWIDPIIINCGLPVRFVTSVEMRDTPLLGDVCTGAGCVFVERRSNRAIAEEAQALTESIRTSSIVAFPESTSSDGTGVLPFKPAFFQSAIAAGMPIQPMCLRYLAVDGVFLNRKSGDLVHWYADMTFLPHVLRLVQTRRIDVVVIRLPVLEVSGRDRKSLAKEAHDRIERVYRRAMRL